MPEDDRSSRTEPPTPRRRQQARERGQVARSADLNGAVILLGFVLFLRFYLPRLADALASLFYFAWDSFPKGISPKDVYAYTIILLLYIIKMLGPILLIAMGLGVGINILQVGVLFTGYPLIPRLERLNPMEGFKRLFSSRTVIQTLIGVFKVLIVGWIVYSTLKKDLPSLVLFIDMPVRESLGVWLNTMFYVIMKIIIFLLVLAILDYGYTRWEYERSLMMTKEEVKEELKQMEGDPQIKARIRRVQRELARQRMMKEVETADVVITNPTHIAVALRYDPERDSAPVVVAKGMRLLAERIREIAISHDVPIVENPPLARTLYRTVEVGETIPEKLYRAVAEILAYVYRLKGKVVG